MYYKKYIKKYGFYIGLVGYLIWDRWNRYIKHEKIVYEKIGLSKINIEKKTHEILDKAFIDIKKRVGYIECNIDTMNDKIDEYIQIHRDDISSKKISCILENKTSKSKILDSKTLDNKTLDNKTLDLKIHKHERTKNMLRSFKNLEITR